MDKLFLALADAKAPGSNELSMFVRDVEGFLNFVIGNRNEFNFLWQDDPHLFDLADETLRLDIPGAVGALRDAIPRIERTRLESHGLLGRPLRFKFNVIASLARRWDKVKGSISLRGWFKQIVEAIDAVLDSLLGAAGGIGGMLKEFKDALAALAPTS